MRLLASLCCALWVLICCALAAGVGYVLWTVFQPVKHER